MATRSLTRPALMPNVFEDFFRPMSQWFDDSRNMNRIANVPAVNIKEDNDKYMVSLAAPGLKKEDFKINVEENVLTISSEKEESKEQKEDNYSRREYSYSSFTRSFSLPDDVKQEAIDARYENGELRLTLPRKEEAKKAMLSKKIDVK
ncbi:Hsp20/alpha crystallin family protein [Flavisolibacter nicotianae]|uniref:Hsp20/alpha crystallin family protein n=1 Tax=Flavisolibacter nicotianae TaxID=2364882 RepID=UPI000EB47E59|nr:Hsp20/alpha crystallin family protein [Flavisolibacter nicotianae]